MTSYLDSAFGYFSVFVETSESTEMAALSRIVKFEISSLRDYDIAGPMRLLGWLAARGRSEKAGRASGEMRRISFEEKIFSFSKFLVFFGILQREMRRITFEEKDFFLQRFCCFLVFCKERCRG